MRVLSSRCNTPPYETAKLGEITDEYYFAAQCSECKHGRRLNIKKLHERLGAAFPVVQIRKRLRCERCGKHQVRRGPGDHMAIDCLSRRKSSQERSTRYCKGSTIEDGWMQDFPRLDPLIS